jgi:flagellar basal-body rod modification protein FlgD
MSTVASSSTTPVGSQTLSQADFLQLLVTQMTSQDPLNPQSDTAFAAQLAQFSALQQSQTMTGNIQGLQANTLIGRQVSVASATNGAQGTTGTVTGVDFSSGSPQLVVNGQEFALSQVTAIAPAPAATTTPTTSSTPSTTSSSSSSSSSSTPSSSTNNSSSSTNNN